MISKPIYACITEGAIAHFKPTWLMIKQHKITGLKYFCKTVKTDPYKYPGSGTLWGHHINKHGKEHIETIWCERYTDIYELVHFALTFSKENDIVASKEWANLIPEDGLGRSCPKLGRNDKVYTPERNAKISAGFARRREKGIKAVRSEESKQRHRETLALKKALGIKPSKEHCAAIAKGLVGNTNGAGHVVHEDHKNIISKLFEKTYKITYPDGSVETIINLRKWLLARGLTGYPARGTLIKKGIFAGYTFTVCT